MSDTDSNRGNTALMRFASEGDIENATQLLTSSVEINERNEQGATALLIAVLNNKTEMVIYCRDAWIF